MSRAKEALALLVTGALVRVAYAAAAFPTPLPDLTAAFTSSDMHAYWAWAASIRAGDLLGRETPHPYFRWMEACGPPEAWDRFWGGRAVFQQAPLYPYLLAVLGALTPGVRGVLGVQLLLGCLRALVVWRLAARFGGERAGLFAGALAAVYGPFVVSEGAVLRDWVPAILEPAAVLLLMRAADAGRPAAFATAGAVFGLAVLAKETAVLVLAAAGAWVAHARRAARPVLALVLGAAAALAPLVARNLATGAPPLAVSNRAPEGLVEGNAVGARLAGLAHPPSLCAILETARGSALVAGAEAVRTWPGAAGFLHFHLQKARALLDPDEVPDNLDDAYVREVVPALRVLPGFGWVGPLALAGALAWPRSGATRGALLAALVAAAWIPLQLGPVVGRYRLSLVPWLLVACGVALATAQGAWQAGDRGRAARVALAAAAGAAMLHGPLRHPEVRDRGPRTQEPVLMARLWAERGAHDRAVAETDAVRARFAARGTEEPAGLADVALTHRVAFAHRLLDAGRRAEAERQAVRAEADAPRLTAPRSHYNLGALWVRLGEAGRARAHLLRFLERAPDDPGAAHARTLLGEGS